MSNQEFVNTTGTILMIVTLGIIWYLYDWKITLLLWLLLWANNMERYKE
jgi:hypothetical protein